MNSSWKIRYLLGYRILSRFHFG